MVPHRVVTSQGKNTKQEEFPKRFCPHFNPFLFNFLQGESWLQKLFTETEVLMFLNRTGGINVDTKQEMR